MLRTDEGLCFPIIPMGIKGGMGQSNVWYADSLIILDFREEVLRHIEQYEKKKIEGVNEKVHGKWILRKKDKLKKML